MPKTTRSTRNQIKQHKHNEVRMSIRRSLSEPGESTPAEPTETIASSDTMNSSSFFEIEWYEKEMQSIQTKRKQILVTAFSKLEDSLTSNLDKLKCEIEQFRIDMNQMRNDVKADMNLMKTELTTEFQNALQQILPQLKNHPIKNLPQDS